MADIIPIHNQGVVLIPASKCVGVNFNGLKFKQVEYKYEPYIAAELSIKSCQRFAAYGLTVPSPIMSNYEWQGEHVPFNHQKETADFMVRNPRCFIFNSIGTGKTLSGLWASDFLMTEHVIRRVLIASTLSTLQRVWHTDLFKSFTHRSAVILHGSKKVENLQKDYDYYIINHDGLKSAEILKILDNRPDIDLVIVDEGAVFRNQRTGLWTACNAICGEHTGRRLWWMTGSPMPNAPTDAWAQAKIVNPQTVPKYFTRFRNKTMQKISQYKWVPTKGWEDIVYASLKPSIRFKREECIDLPECMVVDHTVAMSKQQAHYYKKMHDDLVIEVGKGIVTAANEGVKLSKLLQLACGAVYDSTGTHHFIDVKPKFEELKSILEETGDKIIIFTPFKHTIQLLRNWLNKNYASLDYGIVNGSVGTSERNRIFQEFQSGTLNIILAHPQAMAHGLTLTASNTILWWGPIDNYEVYEQANGRITRPGQRRQQYIKHLICSKVEEVVYKRLQTKESMQGIILDMVNN